MSWYYEILCYALIINKYVYISYAFKHLSLLYMYGYKEMCSDKRNYVNTIKYNLLVFTSCVY